MDVFIVFMEGERQKVEQAFNKKMLQWMPDSLTAHNQTLDSGDSDTPAPSDRLTSLAPKVSATPIRSESQLTTRQESIAAARVKVEEVEPPRRNTSGSYSSHSPVVERKTYTRELTEDRKPVAGGSRGDYQRLEGHSTQRDRTESRQTGRYESRELYASADRKTSGSSAAVRVKREASAEEEEDGSASKRPKREPSTEPQARASHDRGERRRWGDAHR